MNANENVMIAGEGEKSSPTILSWFILELDENMTKGEFVNVLKDINGSEMLDEILEAERRRLKNEGLSEKFLRMHDYEF